ncbi:histone H1-like [Scyliorhinus canicula]|uniref:histone H1-like n=1 Tax=Scyliorhinus canicula TaxID=7830 RepID=UPI0018F31D59|nr:histone H1-like [Scyliorhinus canicula]
MPRRQQQQQQQPPQRRPRKPQQAEVRVSQLILQALSARRQRGGLSLASLRKALLASGYDAERNRRRVQLAIKSLVSEGSLVQAKATGSLQLKRQPAGEEEEGEEGETQPRPPQPPAPPPPREEVEQASKPRRRGPAARKAKPPRKTRR